MSKVVGHRDAEFVTERLRQIEQALGDLTVMERINILAYGIAGYVVATTKAGDRLAVTKDIGKALSGPYLDAMVNLQGAVERDARGDASGKAHH